MFAWLEQDPGVRTGLRRWVCAVSGHWFLQWGSKNDRRTCSVCTREERRFWFPTLEDRVRLGLPRRTPRSLR